jgi:hypothetical protein
MFPNCPTPPLKKNYKFKGATLNNIFVHAVSLTPNARFLRWKIDHISVNSKQNSKSHESGAQEVLFDEKPEGRKFRDTVPLNSFSVFNYLAKMYHVFI